MAEPVETTNEQEPDAPGWKAKMDRVLDIAIWLAVLGALAVAMMPRKSGPEVGQPATAHELPLVGAKGVRTIPGELERPLLIEAFASWCGACQRTSGTLEDLRGAEKDGVLDIVAVSVDDNARQALSAKVGWPINVDVLHDTRGEFKAKYKVDVLPTYILIGTDGQVKRVTPGVAGASDIRAWLKAGDD